MSSENLNRLRPKVMNGSMASRPYGFGDTRALRRLRHATGLTLARTRFSNSACSASTLGSWGRGAGEEGVVRRVVPSDLRAYNVIMLYLSNHATMPPELEAAMFGALALLPGVHVDQGVREAAGRSGLGVWMEGTGDGTTRRYDFLDVQGYL